MNDLLRRLTAATSAQQAASRQATREAAAKRQRERASQQAAVAQPVRVRNVPVPAPVAVKLRQVIHFGRGDTAVPKVALPALDRILKVSHGCD